MARMEVNYSMTNLKFKQSFHFTFGSLWIPFEIVEEFSHATS